jgi:hypothetical protein
VRTRGLPSVGLVVAVACALSGCASGGPDVLGRKVTLVPKTPDEPKPKGELLAVEDGRIWLLTKDGVHDFDAGTLREVQVQRHGFGEGRIRRIGLVGGAVSAFALALSCSSVEGNSSGGCAAVGAAVGGILALTGVLSSAALDSSARAHHSPEELTLRAYARFPAGWPKGVPPDALGVGPRPPERRRAE